MAQDDSQERTEEATPKREKELKEKGSVARSKELNSVMLLMAAGIGVLSMGDWLAHSFIDLFTFFFKANDWLHQSLWVLLRLALDRAAEILFPILMVFLFASLISGFVVGGWVFSSQNFVPKLERMNPIKGISKIVSWKSLFELIKAILKFILVTLVLIFLIYFLIDDFLTLGDMEPSVALSICFTWIIFGFLALSGVLVLIAAFDVPFQIWDHARQQKMTKQEVKDEMKETEGKPEVKSEILKRQRQMAKQRMMSEIPKADVVITNPDHFAVVLSYKQKEMGAPVLVAKGVDHLVSQIKKIAEFHEVPIVQIPPLARALYYSTEIGQEIPQGLYTAVAQVLAYIYQLEMYKRGSSKKPKLPEEFKIPDELKR